MRQNSDDGKDGGLTRSSDEAFVMKVEQRGLANLLKLFANPKGEEQEVENKLEEPYELRGSRTVL